MLALVAATALTVFAMSPPIKRDAAPQLSAIDAIRAADSAMQQKGPRYYCASATLQPASMRPEPRLAASHWQLVFYEVEHPRVSEPDGRETFGDIEVCVGMDGEVFGIRPLFHRAISQAHEMEPNQAMQRTAGRSAF